MIVDGLIKSLNSIKFTDFIKMLGFKSKFIMNNIVKRRFGVNI